MKSHQHQNPRLWNPYRQDGLHRQEYLTAQRNHRLPWSSPWQYQPRAVSVAHPRPSMPASRHRPSPLMTSRLTRWFQIPAEWYKEIHLFSAIAAATHAMPVCRDQFHDGPASQPDPLRQPNRAESYNAAWNLTDFRQPAHQQSVHPDQYQVWPPPLPGFHHA